MSTDPIMLFRVRQVPVLRPGGQRPLPDGGEPASLHVVHGERVGVSRERRQRDLRGLREVLVLRTSALHLPHARKMWDDTIYIRDLVLALETNIYLGPFKQTVFVNCNYFSKIINSQSQSSYFFWYICVVSEGIILWYSERGRGEKPAGGGAAVEQDPAGSERDVGPAGGPEWIRGRL